MVTLSVFAARRRAKRAQHIEKVIIPSSPGICKAVLPQCRFLQLVPQRLIALSPSTPLPTGGSTWKMPRRKSAPATRGKAEASCRVALIRTGTVSTRLALHQGWLFFFLTGLAENRQTGRNRSSSSCLLFPVGPIHLSLSVVLPLKRSESELSKALGFGRGRKAVQLIWWRHICSVFNTQKHTHTQPGTIKWSSSPFEIGAIMGAKWAGNCGTQRRKKVWDNNVVQSESLQEKYQRWKQFPCSWKLHTDWYTRLFFLM